MTTLVVTGWRGERYTGPYDMTQEQAHHVGMRLCQVVSQAKVTRVLVGCARGVDAFVRDSHEWELEPRMRPIPKAEKFTAYWHEHGKRAGPERNGRMLDAAGPDALVLAFPHPQSHKGTLDCIKQAIERGMRVRVYPLPVS